MKLQIRTGLFETNSSSIHTCTIASMSDYKDWENGDLMVCLDGGEFVSIEEGRRKNILYMQTSSYLHVSIEEIREYAENGIVPDSVDLSYLDYITYDEYCNLYEDRHEDYIEKSNKLGVVAFGYFGYD